MKTGMTRYLIAILLIGFGTLLILDNIGFLETDLKHAWHIVYPVLFLFIGLKLLFNYFKWGGLGWIFGSFFVIFGSLLLLGQFGAIDYHFKDIFKLWPLLIVYIGFSIVGKSQSSKSRVEISHGDKGYHNKHAAWKYGFSVGNYEYKQPNWKLEPINLNKTAGNFFIDFTKAFIPQENVPVSIYSLAGDVQMLLPENIEFSIEATVKTGEINVLGQTADGINRQIIYKSDGYDEAEQKLTLHVDLKAGSIRLDRV